VNFKIESDREEDGRGRRDWIAEIAELPGVLAYGATKDEAEAAVEALALRVIADPHNHGKFSAMCPARDI